MPEATVAAIITGADSANVLLTRRGCAPFCGQWCLPGGHIDRLETARDAAVREVKEETGLALAPEFFGYFDEILPDLGYHNVVIVFTGSSTGIPAVQSGEVTDMDFFAIDEARSMPLAFVHNAILDAYLTRRSSD